MSDKPQIAESQAVMLMHHWKEEIEWFVIGGPARENEAQYLKSKRPNLKCAGFEPNPTLFRMQQEGRELYYTDKPFPGILVNCALWDSFEPNLEFMVPRGGVDIARGSAVKVSGNYDTIKVVGRTLDNLSDQYGPFNNVALWLDIEHAELKALRGAEELLKRTLLVNVEMHPDVRLCDLLEILYPLGFSVKEVWNVGQNITTDALDIIFAKK